MLRIGRSRAMVTARRVAGISTTYHKASLEGYVAGVSNDALWNCESTNSMFRATRVLRAPPQNEIRPTAVEEIIAPSPASSGDYPQVANQETPQIQEDSAAVMAELEATILRCTAMKEDHVQLKSELGAMRVVRLRGTCPQGFSARYYSRLVEDFNRSPQLFDEDVLDIEKRIAVQHQNIDILEKQISGAKTQHTGDNKNRINSEHTGIREKQQQQLISPFASLQEAFSTLSSGRKSCHGEPFELSKVKWYNEAAIRNGVVTGIKALMAGYGFDVDKSANPLMCVLGASGQGKTDTLKHIQRDSGVQKEIMNTINEHENWTKSRGDVKCKYIVPLFATFHQDRIYVALLEPNVLSALCNRLLSDYLGLTFDAKNSSRLESITLDELIEFIRNREAVEKGCTCDEICIVILIDEVRSVFDRAGQSQKSVLLDVVCSVQQHAFMNKSLTFAVVTSLDVTALHDRVTKSSTRPLHSIPLHPCCSEDINGFIKECIASANTSETRDPLPSNHAHCDLLWAAHGTGGHFRSLKELRDFYLKNGFAPPRRPRKAATAAYILDIVARQLHNPSFQMLETEHIGAVFFESGKSEKTLYDVAMSNQHGVFYQKVDATTAAVRPCVASFALGDREPCLGDSEVARNVVKRWFLVFELLSSKGDNILKDWEAAIPRVEAIAATLIRVVNNEAAKKEGANNVEPVALQDVFRGAVVKQWYEEKKVKLCYRASCSNYANAVGNERERNTREEDEEAILHACKSAEAGICMATTTNYPAIEGIHTLLEEVASGHARSIPVLMQMKACKDVTATDLNDWAQKAHDHAKKSLGQKEGEYYVALYLSKSLERVRDWESRIPKGTIVIERESLEAVLKPFGMTPLLGMIDNR